MANTIGSAGTDLNIRLGQVPDIKDPALNTEFQAVFNSLHLLSQYLGVLRENLESAPGQTPDVSLRFRRRFSAIALQNIAVGAVVSAYAGGIVNGVSCSLPLPAVEDSGVTIGSTGSRRRFGLTPWQHFIALTAAAPGQPVTVGVGPGVIALSGAKCGQTVWAVAAVTVDSHRDANTSTQFTTTGVLVDNGGLYLANIIGQYRFANGGGYNWEGYWLPGYPNNSGGTYYYRRAFLFPIGICISDGFVIFSDYKRSDPLQEAIPI